jgi:hypothetical protein
VRILFLHHSTGYCVWNGGVPGWFSDYNRSHGTDHLIEERSFPKKRPYGWNNYPYDYWNIWVKHAGPDPYMDEPTLEMLTPIYDVIVFKHCFPVSDVLADTGMPAVDSKEKRLENYKLQYAALRQKLLSFPATTFIVWTGAALTEKSTTPDNARRAREFAEWVKNGWRQPGDNVHVWDFFDLETGGGLYMKDSNAAAPDDPHPTPDFSRRAASELSRFIVDVIERRAGGVRELTADARR